MKGIFLISIVTCAVGFGETFNASSGFSVGPSGVQITAPRTGKIPELSYEKGSLSLDFSIFGRGGSSGAVNGPVRILPPITSGGGALTDSDEFFRGIGKRAPDPDANSWRRRR